MSRNVISYYELSAGFRRSMERADAEPTCFTTVSRLREGGLIQMVLRIRGLKAQSIIVALEDESSRQLAGPLILIAAMTGSRRIGVVWPDRSSEHISRWKVAAWLYRLLKAQVMGRLSYWQGRLQVRTLQGRPPAPRAAATSRAILYLDGNLPIGSAVGGSVAHTRGVIEGFIANGFHVDYASGKALPTALADARQLKIPEGDFLAFPPELNCYSFGRAFDRSAESFAAEKPYAFIYQRMSVHNYTGAMLRRTLGIPLVLEYNGSEAWTAANWNKRLRLHEMAVSAERASLLNADLVVTVSETLGAEVEAAGVSKDRIVIYPNCIDPDSFDPGCFSHDATLELRKRLRIAEDARVATFIGTFGRWHGVDFLAKAIHRLIDEARSWVVDSKLHFLLIGDGLKMAEVRALLGGTPYSDFVTLTGSVPQASAPAYLAASDIFLCPHVPNADGSTFFGSPTKLFEYMAMQRPIVASDLAQIGKVLRGAYFDPADELARPLAELFMPGSEPDFLVALRNVIQHPADAGEMATRARAAALNSFTWRHHVAAILSRAESLGILR